MKIKKKKKKKKKNPAKLQKYLLITDTNFVNQVYLKIQLIIQYVLIIQSNINK